MRRFSFGIALCVALAGLASIANRSSAGDPKSPVLWRENFAAALAEAQKSGKPVLVSIHATWCMPCKMMMRTTLRDPQLANALNQRFVPVSLDGDAHADVVQQLGVQAFPTQIILTPTGVIVRKKEGYLGLAAYFDFLQKGLQEYAQLPASAKAPKSPAEEVARTPTGKPVPAAVRDARGREVESEDFAVGDRHSVTPAAFAEAVEMQNGGQAKVALDGFCPVCMIEQAELVVGNEKFAIDYQGSRYCFRSEAEQKRFEESPSKYLPGGDGMCVVTLVEKGKRTPGKIQCPALFGDHVYFFANEELRDKFLRDPERYVDEAGHVTGTTQPASGIREKDTFLR